MKENPKLTTRKPKEADPQATKTVNDIRAETQLKMAEFWDVDENGNVRPNRIQQSEDSRMCSFLSVLHGIKISPESGKILSRMVRKIAPGRYGVKFPDHPEIIITDEEIREMTHPEDNQRYHKGATLGDRIVERAFARLLSQLRGRHIPQMTIPLRAYERMYQREAIKVLLGEKSKSYSIGNEKSAGTLSEQRINTITAKEAQWIKSLGRMIITTADQCHAYTVRKIDLGKKIIEIIDPYDTGKVETKTFSEFFRNFRYIMFTKIPG